jgi:hypothetical protein
MSLRRFAAILLCATATLLAAVVLYLAFGDLGRHKGRIEALVTELIGRPFAIDGAFELEGAAESLARLRQGLPEIPLSMSGN